MTDDKSVSLHPYFKIHAGKAEAFKSLCKRFVEKTRPEPGCLYYSFTFGGDIVYCREGYVDADALLAHVENVGALIQEALTISDIHRFELHGPESELAKLREPLAPMNPEIFVLDHGFRN
jgi:quinol monooxygenase YgiN